MKFVSYLVLLCFSLNVFAASTPVQELERSIDNYQYAISVDWDQKDQAFYDAQTSEFFKELSGLMSQGLTQKEVTELLEKKMANKDAVEAIKLKVSLISKAGSANELASILKENAKDFYVKGASWNGEVLIPVGIGLVVAAALAYAIYWSATHECVESAQVWSCDSYVGGSYGYDYYGGYSYGSTYCGWHSVCTRYVKK